MNPDYENLIESLIKDGYLKTQQVIDAFKKIDRTNFVPEECKGNACVNVPLPIGFNQTISQPLTVAFMLELLEPKAGEKILDVGAGSGWTAGLLAQLVGENGKVIAIERIPSEADADIVFELAVASFGGIIKIGAAPASFPALSVAFCSEIKMRADRRKTHIPFLAFQDKFAITPTATLPL